MNKLDESAIIKIFQRGLGNKGFVSEDVEVFPAGKSKVVVKVDTLVQSTDIPPKMGLADAARKSIVACISDFASKGIKPEFGIISVNLPKSVSRSKINEITRGLRDASREFHVKILGGDTNEGLEFVFHACIFGKTDKIVTRNGARVGDVVFVTGPFGYTAAGLKVLLYNVKGDRSFVRRAVKSVIRPKPVLEFGLKCSKYFSSSMDSSDGLSTTLNEMSRQSNKKFTVDRIPAHEDLYDFAEKNKIDPVDLIFHGGEEYEFVFTVPKKFRAKVLQISSHLKTPIIEIGHIAKGNGVYVKKNEKFFRLKDLGWRHFRKDHSPE